MTDIEKNIDNSNLESKEIIEENTEDVDNEEDILEDDEKLPFPNARVVRLMRESLDANKQIKSVVKKEMNLFLGRIVETICKKMNEFDYSYVDYGMFKQSIETFENIQTIELEKIRIIKALEKIKADCDVLVNDVERKFHE
jgi:histone H3/H4